MPLQFHKRHLAHADDDCEFELDEYRDEQGQQMLLAHLTVIRWGKNARKRIRRSWEIFRQHITAPLYALPMDDAETWRRFVTSMGWRPTGQMVLCQDGIERPLYIHTV